MRYALLIGGISLFIVAWFVPVHESLCGSGGDAYAESWRVNGEGDFEEGTPPGWRAAVTGWDLLVGEWKSWRNPVLGATCFTNLVMLAAVVAALCRRGSRAFGIAVLVCGVWNASWVYLLLDDPNFLKELDVGYYLWTISFFLVGIGLLLPGRRAKID